MQKRYRILRIVVLLYKILAWLFLVGGIITSLVVVIMGIAGGLAGLGDVGQQMAAAGALGGLVGGAATLFATVIYFLLLYAGAEFVTLFLAIEENTRATAQALAGQAPGVPGQ